MCTNPVVSVIIPVYNMQNYLSRCVDSVIKQTYDNLNIILIDDGSTDHSYEICEEYSHKDSRIVSLHKNNSGVADATNLGLDAAIGDYFLFVDSDDYIKNDMIEKLVLAQAESGADIIQTGMTRINEKNEITDISENTEFVIKDKDNIIREFFSGNSILLCLACKLFKRDIFDGYRFESGRNIIDILATPFLLQKCDTYHVIPGAGYYAFFREGSVSRGLMTDRSFDDTLYYLDNWKQFLDEYYPNNLEFEARLQFRTCYEMSTRYELVKNSNNVSNKKYKLFQMRQIFKESFKLLEKSDYYTTYPRRRRVMLSFFSINPFLMTVVSRINSIIRR